MASIYKRSGRPHYRISYFDHQGKRQDVSSGTTDKRAAERIAAKFEADVALRRSGVINSEHARLADEARRPLAEHIAEHLRHVEQAERAAHTLKSRRRDLLWLQEETGATRLSDLSAEGFERARARLRERGRSAMTANHRQESAQAFLNWCVKTGRLASNPLRVLSKLNGDADRRYLRRPLTEDELRRLFEVAEAHGRFAFYAMAFYAGMRRGELSRLRWGDADLEAKTLTVRRGKAKRTDVVPLHDHLVAALKQAKPDGVRYDSAIFPEIVTNKTRVRDFERAGIPLLDSHGHRADLHSLRMTFHTLLAKGGVPPQVAQRLLRHADYRTTLKHYFHLDTQEAGGALRALPELGRAAHPAAERQQKRQQSAHGETPNGAAPCEEEGDEIEQLDERSPLESADLCEKVRLRATRSGTARRARRNRGSGLGNRRSILLSYGRARRQFIRIETRRPQRPQLGGQLVNFIQVTPFMHVEDLERAIAFFRDLLGFEVHVRMSNYAYLHRETVGFRVLESHGPEGAPPGNRRFCYYVDVRDVDALYAELKPKLDTLPPGDVHGPADKPYGMRELLVRAPDGNLLAFGHAVPRTC